MNIPDADSVLRHCNALQVDEDGKVSGAAFHYSERDLDSDPPFLSVCWPQVNNTLDAAEQLTQVRLELGQVKTLRKSHSFAPLPVGTTKLSVWRGANCALEFLHKPSPSFSTHSGIFGMSPEDGIVPDLLAECARKPIPALQS